MTPEIHVLQAKVLQELLEQYHLGVVHLHPANFPRTQHSQADMDEKFPSSSQQRKGN
jgi:hypothetical protein